MIDHLIIFPTDIDLASIGISLPEDEGDADEADLLKSGHAFGACYDQLQVTILPIEIINSEATFDENGETLMPKSVAQGNWLAVRSYQHITTLHQDPRLIAATDSSLANAGQPFVLYKNPNTSWEAMQGRVSPTFAGSKYPFGSHVDGSQLVE